MLTVGAACPMTAATPSTRGTDLSCLNAKRMQMKRVYLSSDLVAALADLNVDNFAHCQRFFTDGTLTKTEAEMQESRLERRATGE